MNAAQRLARAWHRFAVLGALVVAGDLVLFAWALADHRYAIAASAAINALIMASLVARAVYRYAELVVQDIRARPARPWWVP